MIDTKDAVVRFPKGTTLLRGRLNLVLRCPVLFSCFNYRASRSEWRALRDTFLSVTGVYS